MPNGPGVYVFGRCFGSHFEALYVGKATRIRGRVKGHFNNLRLMQHLRNAKIGKRVLLAGVFQGRPGQQLAKSLTLAERAFIRYFLSEGHDLVNKLGTRIRRHELVSDGQHPLRPAKCPQSAGRPASGGGAGISAGFPALGFASKGEAACESPLLGVVSARASSNVFLTSRQNFLVRSSFIDSWMTCYPS